MSKETILATNDIIKNLKDFSWKSVKEEFEKELNKKDEKINEMAYIGTFSSYVIGEGIRLNAGNKRSLNSSLNSVLTIHEYHHFYNRENGHFNPINDESIDPNVKKSINLFLELAKEKESSKKVLEDFEEIKKFDMFKKLFKEN